MAVYVISWDLNKERANYNAAREALITHLKRYPFIRDQGLDSVWFIQSNASATDVGADIRVKMDNNDRLIVSRMRSGEYAGWLSQTIWDWITPRL